MAPTTADVFKWEHLSFPKSLPQFQKLFPNNNECAILGSGTVTITSNAQTKPLCPEGYTLMADLTMHPKCVKGEIIDPVR